MPTDKPRVFVTFEPEVMKMVSDYMDAHLFPSKSATVHYIVEKYLTEYFLNLAHGVTLLQK